MSLSNFKRPRKYIFFKFVSTGIENLVVMRDSVKNTTHKNYKRSKHMDNFIKNWIKCKNLLKKKIPDLYYFAWNFTNIQDKVIINVYKLFHSKEKNT